MTDAVSVPYLIQAERITRLAGVLKGAPDETLGDLGWWSRLCAYDVAGLVPEDLPISQYVLLDRGAVASERARRRAFAGDGR